jgi:hypothetical protein
MLREDVKAKSYFQINIGSRQLGAMKETECIKITGSGPYPSKIFVWTSAVAV